MKDVSKPIKKKAGTTTLADWIDEKEKKQNKIEVSIMEKFKPFTPTSVIRLPKRGMKK